MAKATNYRRLTNDFEYMDEHFALGSIEADGETWYCAINHKYCDDNGTLKVTLNGLQMHLEKTLSDCIRATKASVLAEQGYSLEEICEMA